MTDADWNQWLREHLDRIIGFAQDRGLRGNELLAHVDHARRYAIARRNVMRAKLGDEALIANRIDDAHGAGWMYTRLRDKQ